MYLYLRITFALENKKQIMTKNIFFFVIRRYNKHYFHILELFKVKLFFCKMNKKNSGDVLEVSFSNFEALLIQDIYT